LRKRYIFLKNNKKWCVRKTKNIIKYEPKNARMLFICFFEKKTHWVLNVAQASTKIFRNFICINVYHANLRKTSFFLKIHIGRQTLH